eukprot:86838-Rhodomonas_salina.5
MCHVSLSSCCLNCRRSSVQPLSPSILCAFETPTALACAHSPKEAGDVHRHVWKDDRKCAIVFAQRTHRHQATEKKNNDRKLKRGCSFNSCALSSRAIQAGYACKI